MDAEQLGDVMKSVKEQVIEAMGTLEEDDFPIMKSTLDDISEKEMISTINANFDSIIQSTLDAINVLKSDTSKDTLDNNRERLQDLFRIIAVYTKIEVFKPTTEKLLASVQQYQCLVTYPDVFFRKPYQIVAVASLLAIIAKKNVGNDVGNYVSAFLDQLSWYRASLVNKKIYHDATQAQTKAESKMEIKGFVPEEDKPRLA